MKYCYNNLLNLFFLFFLLSCSKEKQLEPFNLFGNSSRTSSYEKYGRFWTGVALLEKVNCSDTTGFITFPLSLKNNTFVTSSAEGFVACFEHSNLLWERKLEPKEYVISNFVASPKEDIIFVSNFSNVYSLSKEGELNWKINLSDTSKFFSIILATKDGIYFTSSSNILYCVGYDGITKWKIQLSMPSTNYFAEANDGKIILNLTHDMLGMTDTVFCIDTSGKIFWKKFFEKVRLVRTPIVWKSKIFLLGYKEQEKDIVGFVYCLDTLANVLWSKEFGIIPRFLSVSEEGELFLILYNLGLGETVSTIYKLSEKGNIVSKQFITSTFSTPLFISQQIIGAIGYTKGNPVMIFFGKDLTLWKTIDLSKYPSVLSIPAVLDDCTMIFVSTSGNYLVKIDENPIIKLLPW